MSFIESKGPPPWSLEASKTVESTKCPWVGVVGLKVWGWGGRKNKETVTAPLSLEFTQWHLIGLRDNRFNQSITEHWQLQWQTVAFITSIMAQAKTTSISKEFQNVSILIICLLLVLEDWCYYCQQKSCFLFTGRFSNLWIQFNTKMYFHKICQVNFVNSSPFQVEIFLLFPPKSLIEIFKIHTTKTARIWTCGLCHLFWSQRRVLSPPIHLTQLTALALNF